MHVVLQLGVGDLYGLPDFVLGLDNAAEGFCCLRASSDTVQASNEKIRFKSLGLPLNIAHSKRQGRIVSVLSFMFAQSSVRDGIAMSQTA